MAKTKNDMLGALRHATGVRPAVVPKVRVRQTAPAVREGREGKSNVTGYFPQAVKKQLRQLSVDQDKTIQRMLAEALNDYFAKHGKPEVAPLDDNEGDE